MTRTVETTDSTSPPKPKAKLGTLRALPRIKEMQTTFVLKELKPPTGWPVTASMMRPRSSAARRGPATKRARRMEAAPREAGSVDRITAWAGVDRLGWAGWFMT